MTSKYADRELAWAAIVMQLDIHESRIANASLCHPYFVRDEITALVINEIKRIGEDAR